MHRGRCITRTELDGSVTVLADRYRGKRLNSPNDVVCKSGGAIWFGDHHYGINTDYEGGKQTLELPATLYRLDPHDGTLTVVADDFQGPNGLCFSPDERLLYVAESGRQFAPEAVQHIRVFDLSNDGAQLRHGRVFHKVQPGFADGFRCDEDGRLELRRGRSHLEQRRRRCALHRPARRSAGQDQGAIAGVQPCRPPDHVAAVPVQLSRQGRGPGTLSPGEDPLASLKPDYVGQARAFANDLADHLGCDNRR